MRERSRRCNFGAGEGGIASGTRRAFLTGTFLTGLSVIACAAAAPAGAETDASNYPDRPVRIVVPYPPGGGTPAGPVEFFVDGASKPAATVSLNANGVATFVISNLSIASLAMPSHSITAQYLGNSNYTAASPATDTLTVSQDGAIFRGRLKAARDNHRHISRSHAGCNSTAAVLRTRR